MLPTDFFPWFKKHFAYTSSFLMGMLFLVVDGIGVMLCFGAGFFLVNAVDRTFIIFRDFVNYWIYVPAFFAVFFVAKLYPGSMLQPADEVRRFSISSFFCFTGIALSIAVETDDKLAISIALLLAVPVSVVVLPVLREIIRNLFSKMKWWGVPVVIYGSKENAQLFVDRLLSSPSFGYKPALIIDEMTAESYFYRNVPVFSSSEILQNEIHKSRITTAIKIDESSSHTISNIEKYENFLRINYRYVITIPYFQNIKSFSLIPLDFGGIMGFSSTNRLKIKINLFAKRCIDLFLLFISSPIVLPVMLLIAILVKVTSKGPVFFGHKRIGKNGKQITTWKFRSMVSNASEVLANLLASDPALQAEWDAHQKLSNDPRITKVGSFLRKTSLDELPQLFNILKGEMSFIGPRPIVTDEIKKYGENFEYVFSVTPGLSGMWQISGRSDTGYEERIILDTYYIQNWSIWLDIWIILKTVSVVLKGKGAY